MGLPVWISLAGEVSTTTSLLGVRMVKAGKRGAAGEWGLGGGSALPSPALPMVNLQPPDRRGLKEGICSITFFKNPELGFSGILMKNVCETGWVPLCPEASGRNCLEQRVSG